MSILIDAATKVVVQGITGRDGSFHTQQMLDYGTKIVGGVTPGKAGQTIFDLPVFDTVQDAVEATGAELSVMYVPAKFAKAAMLDAANSDIRTLVAITEGIPTLDVLEAYEALTDKGIRLIGPNCPGLITPGGCKVGIMPASIHTPGNVGVISRSGTLTYEIVNELTNAGFGQTTCIGIGGDPVIGSKFVDLLPLFEADPDTQAIVIAGEIGGQDEVIAAQYFKDHMSTPIVGFMAGLTAPPGKRMGHAGAIVGGEDDTAAAKIEKLEAAGIPVAKIISDIVGLVREKL
ncbi:MAG: succinate--CoA ligase subunit alpha [Candidatus Hydrogenedentes bacterium]|nr:succinate--CoA ligase subunit alpha [Candidatus Hydrogenedentota bacterium]